MKAVKFRTDHLIYSLQTPAEKHLGQIKSTGKSTVPTLLLCADTAIVSLAQKLKITNIS